MTVFAGANPGPIADGQFYCQNALLPAAENDVYNLPGIANNVDPIGIWCQFGLSASVLIVQNGQVNPGTNYVILQCDQNDNQWVDVTGIVTTGVGLFFLSSAPYGPFTPIQQTRLAGTAPAANFTNACVLGGRVRFVGKTTSTLSSSGSSASLTQGLPQGILATIKYRQLSMN